MLLRICLILTIVAGLATAYLAFVPVKEMITTTREARDDFNKKWKDETTLYTKTKKELDTTKANLAATTAKLTETQSQLEAANTKNTELEKDKTDLTANLAKMTDRANTDEQELEKWRQIGKAPEEIKGIIGDLDTTKKALNAVKGENKLLLGKNNDLQEQINRLVGVDFPPPMPGLKGRVLAVDPKFDFVVLDVGEDQGAKIRGEMMVNRKGRLVGKVRISSIQKDRCVATIMPAWKRGEVMEGDQVLY
jgi:hypothetical protein